MTDKIILTIVSSCGSYLDKDEIIFTINERQMSILVDKIDSLLKQELHPEPPKQDPDPNYPDKFTPYA